MHVPGPRVRSAGLFQKVLLAMLGLFALTALTSGFASSWNLEKRLDAEYRSKGTAIASSIASSIVETMLNGTSATVQSTIDQFAQIEGVAYIYIEDRGGQIVSHTFVPRVPPQLLGMKPPPQGQTLIRDLGLEGVGEVTDISTPILEGIAGRVHVGMDHALIRAQMRAAMAQQVLVIALPFLACAVVACFFVRRVARPLAMLSRYAGRIAEGDRTAAQEMQVELGRAARQSDEVGKLAAVFLRMAGEVQTREEHLRQEVTQLRIEIDQGKKEKQVAEITDSEYFKQILGKVEVLRSRRGRLRGDQ